MKLIPLEPTTDSLEDPRIQDRLRRKRSQGNLAVWDYSTSHGLPPKKLNRRKRKAKFEPQDHLGLNQLFKVLSGKKASLRAGAQFWNFPYLKKWHEPMQDYAWNQKFMSYTLIDLMSHRSSGFNYLAVFYCRNLTTVLPYTLNLVQSCFNACS